MSEPVRAREISPRLFLLDTGMSGRSGYTSVYLVRGERAALLDAGVSVDAPALLAALVELGLPASELDFLALTHAHYDHAGGAWEILRRLSESGNTGVRIACAEKPAVYLARADLCEKLMRSGKMTEGLRAGEMRHIPQEKFLTLRDGSVLELGGVTLRALEAPGHANGHLVFFSPELNFLYAGDACGLLGRGADGSSVIAPTSFAPEYRHQLYVSTLNRIADLKEIKIIGFAHFGVLADPGPALHRAADQTEELMNLARAVRDGMRDRQDALALMEKMFSPGLLSLYPSRDRLRLSLKSMLAGLLHDLDRKSQ